VVGERVAAFASRGELLQAVRSVKDARVSTAFWEMRGGGKKKAPVALRGEGVGGCLPAWGFEGGGWG
jgi:hypothetical protein